MIDMKVFFQAKCKALSIISSKENVVSDKGYAVLKLPFFSGNPPLD